MPIEIYKRKFWIGVGMIAGSALVFAGIFYWLGGDLAARANEARNEKTLIGQHAVLLDNLARLKADVTTAEVYEKAMQLILPNQDKLLEFPKWIDASSRLRQVGYSFNFRGSAAQPSGESPGYINFILDLSGQLDNLSNLLKDMESGRERFLIRFDNFDLSRAENVYRLSIQGKVFFK